VIIVDTSVLVALFRGHATAAACLLRKMAEEDTPFAIPAICCQELLQGARDLREWRTLCSYLDAQEVLLPLDPWQTHVGEARMYFDARRHGLTVSGAVDCLVAEMVLQHGGVLLHDDDDYELLAQVRPLRLLRPPKPFPAPPEGK
jgi:predicted nucleic acid-binding protein